MTDQELRTYVFFSIISMMMVWEFLYPKRALSQNKFKRWLNNIALVAFDGFIVRLLLPAGAVGIALWANEQGLGLLNIMQWQSTIAIIIAIIILDMVIYWQHRLFHAVPMLWRLHQVHHADRDIDVSTGLRFHPIEILLSMLIKYAAVLLLGAPAIAVLAFEILLNGMAMFNHSNIKLAKALDSLLRLLLVTPDMHRVHHSTLKHETNSNYGFNISLWDKVFGSYHAQPDMGHHNMSIGLEQYQHQPTHNILWLLRLPFKKTGGNYAKKEGVRHDG